MKFDLDFKELVRGSGASFTFRIAGMLFGYISTMLMTRFFGADALGCLMIASIVVEISGIFGRFGTNIALLRLTAEHYAGNQIGRIRDIYLKIISMITPVSLLLTTAIFMFSREIAVICFGKEQLTPYIRIAALMIFPVVLNFIHQEGLRGLKKINDYSFLKFTVENLLMTLVLAAAVLFCRNEYMPVISYVSASFGACLIGIILWVLRSRILSTGSIETYSRSGILGIALPLMLANSLVFLMGSIDTLILGILGSTKDVGIYSVAIKVSRLVSITQMAVNSISAPKFAEMHARGDISGLDRITRQSNLLIFWTSVPALLFLVLFPGFTLDYFFGSEFRIGAAAMLILCTGNIFDAATGSVISLMQMTGRQVAFQNIAFLATAVNVILNWLLIPAFGINGAALANFSSIVTLNLCSVIYLYRKYGILSIYLPFIKVGVKGRSPARKNE